MALRNISGSLKTRSDIEIVDPSFVGIFVLEDRIAQYFNVALVTALAYHSITTMDKEIKYFWSKPCRAVSIIYFANRYIGLLAAILNITFFLFTESFERCRFTYWIASLADTATIVMIDYILHIRVLALYHQNKKLSILLKVLLSLEAGLRLGIVIYETLLEDIAVASLWEGVTVCVQNADPPRTLVILSWVAPLAYGLLLMVLALFKAAEHWKLTFGLKGFDLVNILIRDQVLYFGLVIFCSVCKIVDICIIGITPFVSNVLGAAGSPILLCMLGGQLLFNLKEAGERGANGGTNYIPENFSAIEFGGNGANNEQSSDRESTI